MSIFGVESSNLKVAIRLRWYSNGTMAQWKRRKNLKGAPPNTSQSVTKTIENVFSIFGWLSGCCTFTCAASSNLAAGTKSVLSRCLGGAAVVLPCAIATVNSCVGRSTVAVAGCRRFGQCDDAGNARAVSWGVVRLL